MLRDGTSQLIRRIPDELLEAAVEDPEQRELLRSIGMRSVMVVPMVGGVRHADRRHLVHQRGVGPRFTEADLELCEELGRRAGIAVENARLYTERSLIAAHAPARRCCPPALPDIPGFSLSALYRPAGEENWVGGDFYDAFAVRDGWVVVVGDVAGRGAKAAALTALRRATSSARGAAARRPARRRRLPQPAALRPPGARRCARSAPSICARAARTREATIVCAGHPLPFAVRQAGAAEPVGRWGRCSARGRRGDWTAHDDDARSRATCSCSTPTA